MSSVRLNGIVVLALWATLTAQSKPPATAAVSLQVTGQARTSDRAPLANATITLRWRAHPELPGLGGHTLPGHGVRTKTATADGQGRFRIDVPVAGPFELFAASPDGRLASLRKFPVLASSFAEVLVPKEQWLGGTVVAEAAAAAEEDVLLTDYEFELVPHQQTWFRHRVYGSPMLRVPLRTNGNGAFRTTFPSAYLKEAFWENYLVAASRDASRTLSGAGLMIPFQKYRKLKLEAAATPLVRGTVVAANGKPIAAARVFDAYLPWREVRTGKDGSFAIHAGSSARLHAVADRYLAQSKLADRPATDATVFELRTSTQRTMQLTALAPQDTSQTELQNRPVLWLQPLGPYAPLEQWTQTDDQGRVQQSGEGISARAVGFVDIDGVFVPFVPAALQADKHAATPVQRRQLSGSVVDRNNNPLPFARIVAKTIEPHLEAASELLWVTYADHGGRFQFPSLLPGRLMVMAAAGRGGYATSQAKPGQQEIELRAGNEEPFEAIVLDAEEQPVAGAWVTMTCFGQTPADVAPAASAKSAALVAFTDAQGRVRFDSLPDGNWHLIAMRLHHTAAEQDILEMAGPTAISRGSELSVQLEKQ